jgi:soluble lytic murein transglycosylase-like protein
MIKLINYFTAFLITILMSPIKLETLSKIDYKDNIIIIATSIEYNQGKYLKYKHLVATYSRKFAMPENLIHAIIAVESGYNRRATSSKGAAGFMQLCPRTQVHLKVVDPYSANENIRAGTKYLANLYSGFDKDLNLTLAAYNAGPGNVQKFNGVPPFKETKNYLKKVKIARMYFDNLASG